MNTREHSSTECSLARPSFEAMRAFLWRVSNLEEKVVQVPHHLAHAASAFYPSGFERSLIASDGWARARVPRWPQATARASRCSGRYPACTH